MLPKNMLGVPDLTNSKRTKRKGFAQKKNGLELFNVIHSFLRCGFDAVYIYFRLHVLFSYTTDMWNGVPSYIYSYI